MKKKLTMILMLTMLAVSATGCMKPQKAESHRVKCPACGYEFEVPAPNP